MVGQSPDLPVFDLLLVILSGETEEAAQKRQLLRALYQRYGKRITVWDTATGKEVSYSFKVSTLHALLAICADI
jgi:hypothetical protein